MVTTHWMAATSLWKSARTTGRMVLTTLPSSAAMNEPVPMAMSTHHLRSSFFVM
jgi:hypothetical protein